MHFGKLRCSICSGEHK